jgi:methylenetetrahydrofolate reductase (NADPH)
MNSHWTANTTAYVDRPPTTGEISLSVEMFPPRNDVASKKFDEAVKKLAQVSPEFFSVTCGAGGSTREATGRSVGRIKKLTRKTPAAAHLTCIDQSKDQVQAVLDDYLANGISHIVALRGDPAKEPTGDTETGYQSALELVRGIRSKGDFTISVAAYPEGHPEAESIEQEIRYLKQKVDAGADQIITQFFFDTEVFTSFLDRVRSAGITVPVIPGILPIVNFDRAVQFAEKCGTKIPNWYHLMYKDLPQNSAIHQAISTSIAVEQCRQLMAFGVEQFHFYSLNRAELTLSICAELGLKQPPIRQGSSFSGFQDRIAQGA